MSKRNREKEKRKQKESTPFNPKNFWADKKPVLLFALGFATLMGIFYAFWNTEIFKEIIFTKVVNANAWLAGKLLGMLGHPATVMGSELSTAHFSLSIKQGCDALEPMAIYAFSVLLFPVAFRTKLPGIAVGLLLLFLLNQFRILTLYFFGIHSPALFDIMHIQVWQVVFILIALAMLAWWIIWALKREQQTISPVHEPGETVS